MARLAWPEWMARYQREWAGPDLVAGLTAAAVVIPKALAYASIAGLPLQVGLYTVAVPMLVYAVLGSSGVLSVSTTTTIAILVSAGLDHAHPADAAALTVACATLACLVGVTLLAARLLRLGFIADFISEPVLVGFKAAIGVVIVVDQLPKLLGLHLDKGGFFHNVAALVKAVPQAPPATVIVGVAAIALLVALERWWPRAPAPLVAVAAGIAAVVALDLPAHGVATVGAVPTGLPALVLPDLQLVAALWPPALGIALMSFTETIAAGRAFASPGEPMPQPDRELLATGLSNLLGGLAGAMPAGGGTTQTAVNRSAGARSQLAGLLTALVAVGTMLVLAPLIGLMPEAVLAAVVIVYSVSLVDPAEFREIRQIRRTEFRWALAAFVGVVLLGTLQGVVAAIAISLVALAYQVSDPPVHRLGRKPGTNVFRPRTDEHPEDEYFEGLLIVRPEGRIFFGNAQRLGQKLRPLVAELKPRVLVLDLASVFDLEYTALRMLTEAERRLREEQGVALWLVGLNPGVLEMVRRSPLGDTLGRERMLFNLDVAVERYLALYGGEVLRASEGLTE